MARTPTPYETKYGRRWRVGYSDEHGVDRTRGGFLRRGHASAWARELELARSEGRLREFLDVDAGLAGERVETLHDFMVDWFRLDAGPELATSTAINYLHVYNKHVRPLAGHRPLEQFELPGPVTELLGQMAAAGVGQPTRDNARKVLSSALGWGVEMGRLRANGARSIRRNRRRSRRLSGSEASPVGHHEGAERRKAWAISPEAFAALHRGALDRRTPGRPVWMPARDAIAVSMLYGLGLRPQELLRSGAAVDLDGAQRHAGGACDPAEPVDQRACDTGASAERPRERRNLAAAVARQLHVVGEQRLEPGEIAVLGGREEPGGQLLLLLSRRLEAGSALFDVASGAGGELAHGLLALADDLRDLREPVAEHVVKQQDGALLGGQALQQHQHGQRQRVGRLGVPGRIILVVGEDRLGQPLADVALAAGARGAQLVDRQPGGHGGDERARRGDPLAAVERLMDPQ
jgi:hypothetical protein